MLQQGRFAFIIAPKTAFLSLVLFVSVLLNVELTARELFLEIEPCFENEPVKLGSRYPVASKGFISFSRIDFLASEFALKTDEGQWEQADASLVALFRVSEGKLTANLQSIPNKAYTAIRFDIGINKQLNLSDPNQYPQSHALHPINSGLHWSWQGGYIFMALEGHVHLANQNSHGFSYHLANSPNKVTIEIPISLKQTKRQTIIARFELDALFEKSNALQPFDGIRSTHSRPTDATAKKWSEELARAFSFQTTEAEAFQSKVRHVATTPNSLDIGTPYTLRVSERLPELEFSRDNPLTVQGVALGEKLFNDPVLSQNNTLSCASCHVENRAFSDTIAISQGIDGKRGKRNAMPLFNLAWSDSFFWDGRAPSLEEQALHPILDENEMGNTLAHVTASLSSNHVYREMFHEAFGDEEITPQRIGKAIAQFLNTKISQDSRFDQAMRGETQLTQSESRGFQLFVTENDPELGLKGADCFHCHGGALFTDHRFTNNGLKLALEDIGRAAITGDAKDTGSFKVPSLRNVAVTAPYMHDGRFQTLEDVINHYNAGVVRTEFLDPNIAKHPGAGLHLSEQDQSDLVAFLETLTDPAFLEAISTN